MNNFKKITASPEVLAAFLASIPAADGPWNDAFHKAFCVPCGLENCDDCPHEAERDNPAWWLAQEASEEKEHSLCEIRSENWIDTGENFTPKLRGMATKEHLEHAGGIMDALAQAFLGLGSGCTNKKKFRVMIVCDPESGEVRWERADISI